MSGGRGATLTFLRDDLWPTVIAVIPISLIALYMSASLPSLNAEVASSSTGYVRGGVTLRGVTTYAGTYQQELVCEKKVWQRQSSASHQEI